MTCDAKIRPFPNPTELTCEKDGQRPALHPARWSQRGPRSMSGTYAQDWRPINCEGSIYYDPRQELAARADRARRGGDSYVAVPVALAAACAQLRECGARFVMTHDENGLLPAPQEIQCRKPEGHDYDHFNGYLTWSDAAAEYQRRAHG